MSSLSSSGAKSQPGLSKFVFQSIAGIGALLVTAQVVEASNITNGNLVVVRVGDGVAALTSASQAVFLDEYTTSGAAVQSIALPIAASGLNQPLTNSGSATSEGFLNLSADGQYLVHGGYGAIPGVASIASTTSATVNRVIARIDLAGNVDTTTALTNAFSGNNIRSATSDNGSQFWAAGANGGVQYASSLGATTALALNSAAPTNLRVVSIYAGQLYISSSSGAFQGVSTLGTGLPTTSGQTPALLSGFPTTSGPSAYDYFFADANTLYVADDRTSALGGIQKWTLSSGTWTLQYTLNPAASTGCRGLTGTVSGLGVATLYATTTTTPLNSIVSVTDTGAGSAFTTVATATTNTVIRGIRYIPGAGNTPSTAFCSGDGTDSTCPCTNPGLAGRGCDNTFATGGADLSTSGIASVSADTLVLTGNNAIPFGPGLYYEGSATANPTAPFGVVFGNGLRCAGGTTNRLEVRFADGLGSSSTTVSLAAFGAAVAGNTYHYQLWYRDTGNVGSCTPGAGFNFSNARSLTWGP